MKSLHLELEEIFRACLIQHLQFLNDSGLHWSSLTKDLITSGRFTSFSCYLMAFAWLQRSFKEYPRTQICWSSQKKFDSWKTSSTIRVKQELEPFICWSRDAHAHPEWSHRWLLNVVLLGSANSRSLLFS